MIVSEKSINTVAEPSLGSLQSIGVLSQACSAGSVKCAMCSEDPPSLILSLPLTTSLSWESGAMTTDPLRPSMTAFLLCRRLVSSRDARFCWESRQSSSLPPQSVYEKYFTLINILLEYLTSTQNGIFSSIIFQICNDCYRWYGNLRWSSEIWGHWQHASGRDLMLSERWPALNTPIQPDNAIRIKIALAGYLTSSREFQRWFNNL